MPSTSTLVSFAAAALALILVPGPGMLLLLARGVAGGRRAAILSALGLETGTGVYVTATAVGLSAVLTSSALAFSLVRYTGAAYLVVLAARILAGRSRPHASAAPSPPSSARAYREALLIGVTNPKIAIFFVAFFPQFVDPHRGSALTQVLVLGAGFVLLALAVDLLVASMAGRLGEWLGRRASIARWQRYVTASIYLALGASAAAGSPHG